MGDRLMIQRAISNLLSNAIRHSPPGSLVSIRIDADDAQVRLCVGVQTRYRTAAPGDAERFYRVDSSRSRAEGGTGSRPGDRSLDHESASRTVAVESSAWPDAVPPPLPAPTGLNQLICRGCS
jgi:two-component system heavy metal sensor histidine kinase CusS